MRVKLDMMPEWLVAKTTANKKAMREATEKARLVMSALFAGDRFATPETVRQKLAILSINGSVQNHLVECAGSGLTGSIYPPGIAGKIRLNAHLGVRCTWCVKEGNTGCVACAGLRAAWPQTDKARKRQLAAIQEAAIDGDEAAGYAASDWIDENLGIPGVGLWWPFWAQD